MGTVVPDDAQHERDSESLAFGATLIQGRGAKLEMGRQVPMMGLACH